MQPTLEVNDRLLIDHRTTLRQNWKRGDILLFDPPEEWGDSGDLLTKRLIGLPGETISIATGRVTINGRVLVEPYLQTTNREFAETITLLPGQYFVMGDNRGNSEDSRALGPINEENIRGRAVFCLTPIGRMGRLPHPDYGF
jgi:signal peptidase I